MSDESELQVFFESVKAGINALKSVRDVYNEKVAFDFTAMDFFRPGENKTSEILAFFLDPKQTHGQKVAFLRAFLVKYDLHAAVNLLDQEKPIDVRTEDRTEEARRIDITVNIGDEFMVGIENKIGTAADQPNQLKDYNQFLRDKSSDRYVLFYLSPRGQNPSKESIEIEIADDLISVGKLRIISYENDIINLFVSFEQVCRADNVRAFIKDFQQYLRQRYTGEKIMGQQEIIHGLLRKNLEIMQYVDGIVRERDAIRRSYVEQFSKGMNKRLTESGYRIQETYEGGKIYFSIYEAGISPDKWQFRIVNSDAFSPKTYVAVGKKRIDDLGWMSSFTKSMTEKGQCKGSADGWMISIVPLPVLFTDEAICSCLDINSNFELKLDETAAIVLKYLATAKDVLQQIASTTTSGVAK